jgi:hypothetical protein
MIGVLAKTAVAKTTVPMFSIFAVAQPPNPIEHNHSHNHDFSLSCDVEFTNTESNLRR